MKRKAYPSDLTDRQWALLEPLLPAARPGGRPRAVNLREIVNALFYLNRNGCTWRALPHDLPPWKACYNYSRAWVADGTWARVHDALRESVRTAAGKQATPSAAAVDSQSVKGSGQGRDVGFDAAKKVKGRKRHIAVDTVGLLLAVAVTGAAVQDADGGMLVMAGLGAVAMPRLRTVWVDSAYNRQRLWSFVAAMGWLMRVVRRAAGAVGFVLLARRWVVERTFGWPGRYRRNSRDYEGLTACSEAMPRLSMIHLMLGRLAPKRTPWSQRFRYTEIRYRRLWHAYKNSL